MLLLVLFPVPGVIISAISGDIAPSAAVAAVVGSVAVLLRLLTLLLLLLSLFLSSSVVVVQDYTDPPVDTLQLCVDIFEKEIRLVIGRPPAVASWPPAQLFR